MTLLKDLRARELSGAPFSTQPPEMSGWSRHGHHVMLHSTNCGDLCFDLPTNASEFFAVEKRVTDDLKLAPVYGDVEYPFHVTCLAQFTSPLLMVIGRYCSLEFHVILHDFRVARGLPGILAKGWGLEFWMHIDRDHIVMNYSTSVTHPGCRSADTSLNRDVPQ